MDLRRLLRLGAGRPDVTANRSQPSASFAVDVPPEMTEAMTGGGALAPRISRNEALQVPAVLRGRNLICSTLAGLPLHVHGPQRRVVETVEYLTNANIDPDVANIVTIANTIEDLLFEGIAWWRVTQFGQHGYPVEARWVPESHVHVHGTLGQPATARVSQDLLEPRDGRIFIDGVPVSSREVIRFDAPNPPLLQHAARAVRTCLLLDRTTAMYADEPFPLGALEPQEGAEPLSSAPGSASDGSQRSEVEELLDSWETARKRRAWAYLQKVNLRELQWNPEQLQLADQRQHAVLEIARAMGVDPEDLGVSTTSRTYQNSEQRRQDLLDFTLSAYMTAVESRLSMRDVLPSGHRTKFNLDGFLRSDTRTRMETYQTGLNVGAYTQEEIRELEDRPPLTPAQQARAQQRDGSGNTRRAPDMAQDKPDLKLVERFEGEPVRLQFDDHDVADTFQVDSERRTITGIAVPWGKVARSGFSNWRFAPDSLRWSDASRVKLNLNHDFTQLIGRATRLQSGNRGLMATFKVAKGSEGDRALSLAEDRVLDGLSIEVDFNDDLGDSWQPDPSDESVRLVRQASLRGTALTGMPAFDDARVERVAAMRQHEQEGAGAMPDDNKDGQAPQFDLDGYLTQLSHTVAESHNKLTEQLTGSIGQSVSAGVKAALENMDTPHDDGPQPVRAARYSVTREEPVYAFNGMGHSLVRDVWHAAMNHDSDAHERIRRYRQQTDEMSKLAAQHIANAQFQTSTSNASEIIPPGYRPDLYVPELEQGRPLTAMCARGSISNATPFVVPVFGSSSGVAGDHTEGTNPSDGTLSFDTQTVSPEATSGRLTLTREIVDSSNPGIDQIALATMRESYNRQTEQKVYAALNGTASGTSFVEYADGSVITDVRGLLADYPFVRFAAPTGAAINQKVTKTFATTTANDGRPLLPSVGAENTAGLGNAVNQGWFVDGLAFVPAWSITDNDSDDVALIVNRTDVWVWESPLLTFRFEEKQGPANIEMNIFGYFASHVLRPAGVFSIRNPAGV